MFDLHKTRRFLNYPNFTKLIILKNMIFYKIINYYDIIIL